MAWQDHEIVQRWFYAPQRSGLVALTLALGMLLLGAPTIFSAHDRHWGDHGVLDVPLRMHAASLVRQGDAPWWTSDLLCGYPLAAVGLAGVFYPPSLLYVVWPTPNVHDLFFAVHLAIGGLGLWVFLQRQGWNGAVVAVCVLAWMVRLNRLGGGGPPLPTVLAWLPWALAAIDLAAGGDRRGTAGLAVVNALMVLSGQMDPAVICWLLELAYLGFRHGPRRWRAAAGIVAWGMGGAAVLAAVQIVPLIDYLGDTERLRTGTEHFTAANYMPPSDGWSQIGRLAGCAAVALLLGPRRTEALFWLTVGCLFVLVACGHPATEWLWSLPGIGYSRWPKLYASASVLALSIVEGLALISAPPLLEALSPRGWIRRYIARALLSLAWVAVVWQTVRVGHHDYQMESPSFFQRGGPLARHVNAQPGHVRLASTVSAYRGVSAARSPEWGRSWFEYNAAWLPENYNLCYGLAAPGVFSDLESAVPRRMQRLLRRAMHPICPPALIAAGVSHLSSSEPLVPSQPGRLAIGTWLVHVDSPRATARIRHESEENLSFHLEGVSHQDFGQVQAEAGLLRLEAGVTYQVRLAVRGSEPGRMVVGLGRGRTPWTPVAVGSEIAIQPYWTNCEVALRVTNAAAPGRLVLGLGRAPPRVQIRGLRIDREGAPLVNWLAESFAPDPDAPVAVARQTQPRRAWMVHQVRRVESDDESLAQVCSADFSPYAEAVVEEPCAVEPAPPHPPQIKIYSRSSGRLQLDVETQSAGLLVIADRFDRHRRATVDGQAARVLRVNHAFCGIELPAGSHRVELAYRPTSIVFGGAISLVGLAGWIALLMRASTDRRPAGHGVPD